MKLSELISKLKVIAGETDPEIVFQGAHGFECHYEESDPIILRGWFQREPHEDPHGTFRTDIREPLASEIGDTTKTFVVEGKTLLVSPAIYVGMSSYACNHDDFTLKNYPKSIQAQYIRDRIRMKACKESS